MLRHLTACAMLALSACGLSTTANDASVVDTATDAGALAFDEYGRQRAAAECARAARCGTLRDFEPIVGAQITDCAGQLYGEQEARYYAHVADAIARGTVTYRAELAAACVAAIAEAACGGDALPCLGVLVGTAPDGAGCVTGTECASEICQGPLPRCGACSAQRGGGLPCTVSSDCENQDCVDGVCRDPASRGEPCDAAGLLACWDPALACIANVCAPLVPVTVGMPCSVAPRSTQRCAMGLACASGTCVQLASGQCATDDDCASDRLCDSRSGLPGMCIPYPPLGAPCPDALCAAGSHCAVDAMGGQSCIARGGPNGATCEIDYDCFGGHCVASVCTHVVACGP